MKKMNVALCVRVLSVVLAVIGLITMIISHLVKDNALVYGTYMIALGVVAVIFILLYTMLGSKCSMHSIVNYLTGLIGVIIVTGIIGLIIFERAYLASALFTWDPHNVNGWTAFYTSVASVIVYFFVDIVLVVTGFMSDKKN